MHNSIHSGGPDNCSSLKSSPGLESFGMNILHFVTLCIVLTVSPLRPIISPTILFGIFNGVYGPGEGLFSPKCALFCFILICSHIIASISFFAISYLSFGPSINTLRVDEFGTFSIAICILHPLSLFNFLIVSPFFPMINPTQSSGTGSIRAFLSGGPYGVIKYFSITGLFLLSSVPIAFKLPSFNNNSVRISFDAFICSFFIFVRVSSSAYNIRSTKPVPFLMFSSLSATINTCCSS